MAETETLETTETTESTLDDDRAVFDRLTADAADADEQPERSIETEKEGYPATATSEAATETARNVTTDGAGTEEAAEPEGLDEAIAALQRDGIPEERITAWYDEDAEGMVQHGLGRAKAQKDQDSYGFDYRENREEFERWKGGHAAEDGETATETTGEEVGIESILDDALSPLNTEENADLFGDASGAIKSAVINSIAHIEDKIEMQFASQVERMSQQIAEMKASDVDRKLDLARDRMTDRYPKLKSNEVYQSVLEDHYDTLISSPKAEAKYNSDPSEAFSDACKLAFGDTSVNELKETLLSRSKQHRNGQPRAQTAGSTASNTMSDYEKEQSAFFELRRKHYGKAE